MKLQIKAITEMTGNGKPAGKYDSVGNCSQRADLIDIDDNITQVGCEISLLQ